MLVHGASARRADVRPFGLLPQERMSNEADDCALVVLQGPCGSGKTAAVYACAAELGYKVIEVNASMLRSGKVVLSNFAEVRWPA